MESLFSQERASAAYLFEIEVKTYVETLKEHDVSIVDAVQMVMSRFGSTKEVAKNQVAKFWD